MDSLTREMYDRIANSWMLRDSDSTIPCYCTRYVVNGEFDTESKIKAYILAAREWSENEQENCHLNMFSVTAEDWYHQKWLNVAKKMGMVVVKTTSRHEGNYDCWMILDQWE